ncbi:hypothetical protein KEM52_003299 [Ascosphaera acerosa]|nr:hypothetical protein KEM52_003299 [Ascosphaera acerosa]
MYQPPIQSGYHQPNGSNAPSYGVPGPQPGYGQGMSSEAQALGTTPAMPQAAMLNLSAAGVHVPGLGIGGGHPSQPQPPQQSPPPLHQPAPQYAPGSAPSQQVAQATHELQQRFANLGLSRQTTETSSQYSRESGFNAAPQAQQQAYDYAPPAQPQPVQDYQQSQPVPQQQQGHLPSQPAPRQPSVSSVPSVIGKKKPPPPPPKKKNIALPGQIPAPAGPPPAAAAAPAQPAQGSLYGPPLPFGAPRPY